MRSMKPLWLVGVAVAVVVAGVALGQVLLRPPLQFQGQVLPVPRPAPVFSLTNQDGQPFHFSAVHAEATLLFFGYTFCPDVCPTTMAEYRQVIQALGRDASRVQFIFVSVDPGRDTPARLKDYLGRFHQAIIGLTGTEQAVADVVKAYGVVAEKAPVAGSQAGYLVSHTASVFLVDQAGQIRVKFPFGTAPGVMANDLRVVLAGRGQRQAVRGGRS